MPQRRPILNTIETLNNLKEGPKTVKEISSLLEISYGSACRYLKIFESLNLVKKEDGYYFLH